MNTLANQHSYQLIFSSSYQNKWDLATFISEAGQVQKFLDQCYATKADLKNAAGVDKSKFSEKAYVASLKSEKNIDKLEKVPTGLNSLKSKVENLDVGKLVALPVDLSKLSDVVKNGIVKKTEYDRLVRKVNAIQTTDTADLVKNLTMTQKIIEKIILIMILVNILLLKNLIS